jgi:hypothetical protein
MDLLEKEKEVQAAYRTNYRIIVKFRDGIRESWIYDRINHTAYNYILPSDLFNGTPVTLTYEYLYNPLDDNAQQMEKLFKIDYKQWKKGHFWDQRIVIHKLVYKILKEGWQEIKYHHKDLIKDLQALNNTSLKKHFNKSTLMVYGLYGNRYAPGKMILEQYTDWGNETRPNYPTLKQAWTTPKALYATIRNLIRNNKHVTRHNMMYRLNTSLGMNAGHQFICPNTYRTIIKLCSLEGLTIADPYPGCGSKAIATTLSGCEYHTNKDLTRLSEFLGTDFHQLDRDHYDCVIIDNDFQLNNDVFDNLKEWEEKADIKIIFVHKDQAPTMPKPDKYVKVTTTPNENNYLFYYV